MFLRALFDFIFILRAIFATALPLEVCDFFLFCFGLVDGLNELGVLFCHVVVLFFESLISAI